MLRLSPEGRVRLAQIADRSGFGIAAAETMLAAIVSGGGEMAQFDHPEFGGPGQWMRGGLLMLADPSDQELKARVERLCNALAEWVARGALSGRDAGFQRQSQTSAGITAVQDSREGAEALRDEPAPGVRASSASDMRWWPEALGEADSTGAQNDVRYAWFPESKRLAVERDGKVTVYDTGDHRIGGFSQQQGGRGRLAFSSQHGVFDVHDLAVVGDQPSRPESRPHAPAATTESFDPFVAIEKLAQLHARGILGDDEFQAKKRELLERI